MGMETGPTWPGRFRHRLQPGDCRQLYSQSRQEAIAGDAVDDPSADRPGSADYGPLVSDKGQHQLVGSDLPRPREPFLRADSDRRVEGRALVLLGGGGKGGGVEGAEKLELGR